MKLSILALTAIASMIVSGATVPSNQSSKLGNLPEQSIMAAGETHSTDVIAVYSMNEGWYANGNASVAICLSGVTGNGFGVFAGCDIKNERVHIYDKYGQEKDLLYKEECNANSVIINRTKGLSYNGSIIRVPKGFQFAPTNPWLGTSDYVGDVFTLENEAVFVCNLEDGQAGAWDVLQSPKGIVVNQESYSLGLGESAFIAAAPIGVTNVKENYKSSDENVCTVAADGTIAAVGQGSCVISINYGLTRKEVSVTVSSESHEQTGIKIVKGKEITAYTDDDEAYSLSDLKVVKVYNDKPEGEEITIDKSMISGEFNPKVPGEYTLTVTDGKFSDTFKVIIKETAVTGISELQQNYNFGNNSGWGNFYFQTDFNGQMPTQYLNIHDAAFDDLNNHILFNGETGKLRSAKCFNGSRYELWLAEDVLSNLKIGDTITITKDTPIYYYSTTTDGNHEPDGLGKYQK